MGKGYAVVHQKVSVSISLTGRIHGFTELTIVPTTHDLRTVWLNARSLNVLSASLRVPTSIPLAFSYLPPAPPTLTEPTNIHTYPELKRAIWRATNEGEEGELGIALPQGCIIKVAPPEGATPREEAKKEDEWEQIVISVEYEVVRPGAGIVVVGPDDANPSRFPHVFTSSYSDISARTWVPCSDHARERCTWDLELIVPRLLYSSANAQRPVDDEDDDEPDEGTDEWPITVVASGELIEQVVHPDRSDRVIWHYAQPSPISVQQIAWAVGPFVITEIAGVPKERNWDAEEDEDEEELVQDEGPKLHALCLPGRESELAHSVGVVRQAMEYYSSTFGSYPFSSFTVAFVDALASGTPTFHSAAMTLFSSDLLHPPTIIDQAYETRHILAHALAIQWSGINLIAKTASDNWLVIGIALHMTSLFLKSLWGNNEYRFRLKKDMLRCVAQDVQREPISVPARHTQPEQAQLQFIALKAPLVLHILDKFLRKSGTSLGLDKVLPKLFLDAITGEVGSSVGPLYNNLTTTSFMRTCRKACGGSADSIKTFFDQWIYGSGCPTFIIGAMFNRKKMAVELNVKQECLAYNWAQTAPPEEMGHLRPIPQFDGQMTIRIHEADGTPYEHVLQIQEQFKRHEVPFNTKYKRIRRNTKRYQARQAAASAAASGDADAQEDMGMLDLGFDLPLWEDEKEREKWRVADWTEEDDGMMSQATYEWIRIDTDLEWICGIQFEQRDFMWLSQLQRDKDVIAQLEAIHALSRMPSPIVSSNLAKTVLVTNYFFRIRMEAALALISCTTKEHEYLGLFHLFKIFQSRWCFDPDEPTMDPFGFRCIPKTNNFSDLTEYFIKKTILTAISMVRDEHNQTPPVVQQFLVDLLAYNDNLGNQYSDTFYIASVMNALAHAFVAVAPREAAMFSQEGNEAEVKGNLYLEPAIQEVERYMSADRLVPSYHNVITVAGIEWKLKLTLASLIPEDRMSFFCYTRDGNSPPVRIAAFDALLLFNPLQDVLALVRYFFAVLRDDSSKLVQRRLAQSLLYSLPVLAATHDLAAPEPVFEEDGVSRKDKDKDPLANVLKALRKKPGRSMNYRQCLLETLTYPDVDSEVRLCLLKLCEVTVRPEGEPLPKMRFRLPAAVDVAAPVEPAIAKIKLTSTASIPKITLPRSTGSATVSRQQSADVEVVPEEQPFDFNEPAAMLPPPVPEKIKKHKIKTVRVEQAQVGGMSMSDVASCKSMIKKLLKEKSSIMFRAPVDPVKSGAPGYFDIVRNPMDISTMNAKLLAGQYPDRHAFRDDFKLIISNAVLYNRVGIVVDLANKMDSLFDKQWERIQATLRKMENPGAPSTPYQQAPAALPPPPPPTEAPLFAANYTPVVSANQDFVAPAPALPASPSTQVPPPPTAPRTVSFKLSLPNPSAASSSTSPAPAPVFLPPPPPPPKAPGFKITLGGSSLSQPVPNPLTLLKSSKPPKATSVMSDDAEYGSSSKSHKEHKHKHKKDKHSGEKEKKEKHSGEKEKGKGKEKEKERPAFSYAEPDIDLPLAFDSGRPEILDEPPLPHPTRWVKPTEPVDAHKARKILAKTRELREAFFFLYPVEAVDALATYYDEIQYPMDLQTMGEKLDQGRYRNYGELFSDFDLIISNCNQFNTPNTEPIWYAAVMDRQWRGDWERASKLSYNVKRSLLAALKHLMADGAAYPFNESVNTIIDQIPTYYDIIPRGNERDLGTIRRNLEADGYATIEAVDADVTLMLHNCFTFNLPGTPVYNSGVEVKKLWSTAVNKVKAEGKGKKRTGDVKGGGGGSQPKKPKY